MRVAAVAAHFGRDVAACLTRVEAIVADARSRGVDLLVFPDATLGGYLGDLGRAGDTGLPPALDGDAPELARIAAAAGETVVCVGYREAADGRFFNSAVCLGGDGVLGRHRKVHQPVGELPAYAAGDRFAAFDTPLGRIGMLIDYDKTFPESARTLAADGAQLVACLSAWPASLTNRAPRLVQDRQSRLFDLYDCARAAENQVVWVSANQTGAMGRLRFLGQSKVVGPGGDVLARTWAKAGLALAELDVAAEVSRARLVLDHLRERRPGAYA
ncbi:carbon-nitrogen hydrolase family protein [Modestobacter roseus]|uniref:Putative amidohydrolase n=1 Tax=Modestobacter roseus TaxID=1181884 RepID=A0A562IUQ4_9ACTN|nr:carbon-nitrogen hydrolase family protein [Modestobacter roseus]MQA33616.1 carbon-nitrogen hydrolase family protein [Modestobacter roseus]TWH74751.1 putative amidohydrolase [Modestobacter roseus]